MKFKESAYTPKASGKLGGNKFSSNRYGPYSSLKPRTNYKYSVAQKRVTAQMGAVSRLWSERLTIAQYEEWMLFCQKFKKTDSFGNIFIPAPRDIFISCNINLREIGMPDIFDPPQDCSVQTYNDFEIEISFDPDEHMNLRLFFDHPLNYDTRIKIFATTHLKLCNWSLKDKWFKRIGCIDSSFKSGDSFQNLYDSVFLFPGIKSIGQFKIGFRLKTVSATSGFTSPLIKTSAIHESE